MPAPFSFLFKAPWIASAVAMAAAVTSSGCFTSDASLTPPLDTFYFPTGLVVSPGGTTLYVINSDFDLQYNGGTVQALDLGLLRPKLMTLTNEFRQGASAEVACAAILVLPNDGGCGPVCTNDILNPGPCRPISVLADDPARRLVKQYATIGAFASGGILLTNPGGPGARLFVPVRGDPSVTFFDVSDDRDPQNPIDNCGHGFCLECGGAGEERRCDDDTHKLGQNPLENTRLAVLPTEPVGIAATDALTAALGVGTTQAMLIANQTSATVSLATNTWISGEKPKLQFTLPELASGPTEVAAIPTPRVVTSALANDPAAPIDYQPGFLVTYNASPVLDLIRFSEDAGSNPQRPFITRVAEFGITTNADGTDSRGIAIDSSERRACEAACDETDVVCNAICTDIPLRVFIANRSPASLLIGEVRTELVNNSSLPGALPTAASDIVSLYDSIPLDIGPSRVAIGDVINRDGVLESKVFVVTFDSRFIAMYDPIAYRLEATIRTGRGPHGIAFDTCVGGLDPCADGDRSHLYVGHFTDSYLGVVDLDQRNPTFGTMFASVGFPLPPRESR
jgi:hypothetical protein